MDSEEFEENEQDDPSEELKENEPPKNSPYLKDVRRTKDFFVSHTRYKDDSVIGEFKGMPTLWDLKAMTPDNWLKNNLTHRCSKSVKAAKIRNDLKGEIDKIHAFTGLPGHLCLLLALYMHDLCISDMKSLKSSSISIPVSTPNGIDYISSIFKGDINIKNESPRQTETNKILQHNEDVTDKRKGTKTTRNTDLEHWPSYYSKIGQHCVTDPEENKQVDQMKVRVIARNVRVGNKNKKKRRAALSDTQKQEIVYFFDENGKEIPTGILVNNFRQIVWMVGDTLYKKPSEINGLFTIKYINKQQMSLLNNIDQKESSILVVDHHEYARKNTIRFSRITSPIIDHFNMLLKDLLNTEDTVGNFIQFIKLYMNFYEHTYPAVYNSLTEKLMNQITQKLYSIKTKMLKNMKFQKCMNYFVETSNISQSQTKLFNSIRRALFSVMNRELKIEYIDMDRIQLNIPNSGTMQKNIDKYIANELPPMIPVEELARDYHVKLVKTIKPRVVLRSACMENGKTMGNLIKKFLVDKTAIKQIRNNKIYIPLALGMDSAGFTDNTNLCIGSHGSFMSVGHRILSYENGAMQKPKNINIDSIILAPHNVELTEIFVIHFKKHVDEINAHKFLTDEEKQTELKDVVVVPLAHTGDVPVVKDMTGKAHQTFMETVCRANYSKLKEIETFDELWKLRACVHGMDFREEARIFCMSACNFSYSMYKSFQSRGIPKEGMLITERGPHLYFSAKKLRNNERRFGIVNFTNWFEQTYDDYCKNTEFNQLIDTPIHLLTRPGGYGILNTQQHNALMKAVYKGDSEICIKNVKFPLEQKSDANSNNANEQKIQVYREDVTLKIGKTKDDISFTCKTRAILVDTWNDQYHKPLFKIDTVLEDILHTGVLNPGKYDIILLFSYTAIICDLNNIDENVIKDILTDCRQHKLSYLFKTKVDKIEREKLKLTGGPMEKFIFVVLKIALWHHANYIDSTKHMKFGTPNGPEQLFDLSIKCFLNFCELLPSDDMIMPTHVRIFFGILICLKMFGNNEWIWLFVDYCLKHTSTNALEHSHKFVAAKLIKFIKRIGNKKTIKKVLAKLQWEIECGREVASFIHIY
eukprot:508516_1